MQCMLSVAYKKTTLWSFKVMKVDVCGRPHFANLVTNNVANKVPRLGTHIDTVVNKLPV